MTGMFSPTQAPSVSWNPTTLELTPLSQEAQKHGTTHKDSAKEFKTGSLKYTVNTVDEHNQSLDSKVITFVTTKYHDNKMILKEKNGRFSSKDTELSNALTFQLSGQHAYEILGDNRFGAATDDLF